VQSATISRWRHYSGNGNVSRGGSIAVVSSFSTEEFWPKIRETETTVVLLLGAMTNFITKRPLSPEDCDHPLKKVIIVPLSEEAPSFAMRFGVESYPLYYMTETSTPLVSELNPPKMGHADGPGQGSNSDLSTSMIAKSRRAVLAS